MSNVIEITDYNAPELDMFARLTEPQLRSDKDRKNGVFIAESPKVIRIALAAGYEPVAFLMERRHFEGQGKEFVELGYPTYTADRSILEKLTGYVLTRGILCAFKRKEEPNVDEVLSGAKRVALLEDVTDATNVGAIVRSAAALGIDAILLSPSCCDVLNRRAVRVSMGTIFQVPWARVVPTPEDWPEKGLKYLHEKGYKTVALALTDDSVSIDDKALGAEEKLVIILGTEGDGLKAETIKGADYTAKIPMYHGVDSLNVAAASALAFWQLRVK